MPKTNGSKKKIKKRENNILANLKRKVYELSKCKNTKTLKASHEEFKSLDFRRKQSWENALKFLVEFEEWIANPPEDLKEIIAGINKSSKNVDEGIKNIKKNFQDLDIGIKELNKIEEGAKSDIKILKERSHIKIPIVPEIKENKNK
tara:strand:+ start:1600 stop:2040 length:441 start_codon:yes stop_codon:yes gene_type:complete